MKNLVIAFLFLLAIIALAFGGFLLHLVFVKRQGTDLVVIAGLLGVLIGAVALGFGESIRGQR